jgi:SAM-dependent methyltransferase
LAKVEFADAGRVQALSRVPGGAGSWARYLAALLANGPLAYADNADVEMEALLVDGTLLPLVLNRGREGTAETCSPYSHYVAYSLEEVGKRHPGLPPWLFSVAAAPAAQLLRAAGIDRVVSINNWLLSTNPSVRLDPEQVREVTACLTRRYRDRAIVWRSLNPTIDAALIEYARLSGYRLLRSRRVYMVDAGPRVYRQHENARRDFELLKRTRYDVISDPEALAPYVERMAELFRSLYLGKHSRLNTAFNTRFFAVTLATGVFEYRAFRADGEVVAFVAFFVRDQTMTASLLGYDLNLPRSLGLYRLCLATTLAEAASRRLCLNLSAAAGSFKRSRGGVPVDEYDAVYDRHLPWTQRAGWFALSTVSRTAGAARAAESSSSEYDWNALARAWRASGPQTLWRKHSDAVNRALLARWMPEQSGARLLKTDAFDEAFGSGIIDFLAERVQHVIAIDVAEEVLRAALARRSALAAVQADVRRLPFADASVDIVVSNSTLDHFNSIEQIVRSLQELARVLSPGGRLILTMDNPANPIVRLRNALPFGWLFWMGLVPYRVGVTVGAKQLKVLLSRRDFDNVETTAILHCPRVLAVPLAGLLDRYGSERAKEWFQRFLMMMERLGGLSTRFRTGHFVAVRAVKRGRKKDCNPITRDDWQPVSKTSIFEHLARGRRGAASRP